MTNLAPAIIEEMSRMTEKESMDELLKSYDAIDMIKSQQKEDVALNEAKENVKALNSGYKEMLDIEKEKVKYLRTRLRIMIG